MSGPVRRFRFAFLLLLPALALASLERLEIRPLKLSPCHLEGFKEKVLCGVLPVVAVLWRGAWTRRRTRQELKNREEMSHAGLPSPEKRPPALRRVSSVRATA